MPGSGGLERPSESYRLTVVEQDTIDCVIFAIRYFDIGPTPDDMFYSDMIRILQGMHPTAEHLSSPHIRRQISIAVQELEARIARNS